MSWLRREDIEDGELHRLHRFAAKARNDGGRRIPEPEDPLRTAFQRDRDRIIHSAAFRRMQHKTQVFAAFEGDHYRTRMTHSLEVSQMARSVCMALQLNADLAEAVALAHDLGHPPFGHVGEEALAELMAGHGGFRHNAQGARIVDYLEDRYGHGFGLNLTHSTRKSLLKGVVPKGFPLSEDLQPQETESPGLPCLEAQVVDHCDRIAYLCHDVDDGLRAGVFTLADVWSLALWQLALKAAGSPRSSRVVSEMVSLLVHDLVEEGDRTLQTATATAPRIRHGAEMAVAAAECLQFLRTRFYRSPRVLEVMQQGSLRIRSRFAHLLDNLEELPENVRARVDQDGLHRVVCDYVAGMTDRYLLRQG